MSNGRFGWTSARGEWVKGDLDGDLMEAPDRYFRCVAFASVIETWVSSSNFLAVLVLIESGLVFTTGKVYE